MAEDTFQHQRAWQFAQLWTQAHPTVALYVHGLIRDRADAEDIIQDVSVALLKAFADYDPARPFVAWALGVAKHKIHDRWRARERGRCLTQDPELLEAFAAVSREIEAETDERLAALRACLHGVGGRAWELLRLHYHQGHKPQAIAEMMGLKPGHVSVLLNRVREALRQCIRRRLVDA